MNSFSDDRSSSNRAISETVTLVPYDPAWPAMFSLEQARLAELFPGQLILEHIGSTAVPGMPAKPIVDCMAAVASMEIADRLVEQLCENGYTTSAGFNQSLGDRRWLMRHAAGRRTHHLHLVLRGSSYLADSIRFRDALRADAQLARKYAELKEDLARKFAADREAYGAAKSAFVIAVLRNTQR